MQFTTVSDRKYIAECCLLWCKDTNFNAIHNLYALAVLPVRAVYYGAKILILMQFTTYTQGLAGVLSCLLWCKDTNFNAIHNRNWLQSMSLLAVYYGAKILILMRIIVKRLKYSE